MNTLNGQSTFSSSLTCLTGPRSCGKTSLLFQHALCCSKRGHRVLYVSPKPLSRLPLYQTEPEENAHCCSVPPSDVLERITFRYPPTLPALQEVFDRLHLNEAGPWHKEKLACIIVDDFHQYTSLSSPVKAHDVTTQVAQVCAHLVDAASCDEKTPIQCVLATLRESLAVSALQKWFPTLLQVNEVGDGAYDIHQQKGQNKLLSYTIHKTYVEFIRCDK